MRSFQVPPTLVLPLLFWCSHGTTALLASSHQRRTDFTVRLRMASLPSAEESAKALSDYMAKSHIEKLRALKEVEDKKNAEIEALKAELASIKGSGGGGGAATTPPATTGGGASLQELQEKLLSYQRFMAKYIVESQEQKLQAVEDAKSILTKQYEAKLLALGGSPETPTIPPADSLFAKRNQQVSEAGKAGKSRWGVLEVDKASAIASGAVVAAEPLNGATAAESTPGPTLYDARNVMVNAAAKAGKSRWGSMETNRVGELVAQLGPSSSTSTPPPPTIIMTPEIEAADHGLRADGGVSGPSLAERVNLGAKLMGKQ